MIKTIKYNILNYGDDKQMKLKNKIIGVLILLAILTTLTTTTALDTTKNTTIELNGIKLCVPQTSTSTITNASSPEGVWTYTYTDDENNITIYVCDELMPEYALLKEEYNEIEGYTQQIGTKDNKYVMVASPYRENKDFILDHVKELNPE